MSTSDISLVASLSALISLFGFCLALYSFRLASRNQLLQMAYSLHANLFNDLENYKLLYKNEERDQKFHFNRATRGAEGNFVGSSEEPRIDNFLERVNFTCFWLLETSRSRREELLFQGYIRELYGTRFFREYFSFLAQSKRVEPYFSYIHEYAHTRLNLPHPRVEVPGTPASVESASRSG